MALNDPQEWTRAIKVEIEENAKKLEALAKSELGGGPPSLSDQAYYKDRWKIFVKFETQSHSIRPSALKEWNAKTQWLKLFPQQGAKKKEQLLVEMTFRNDVPASILWRLGFTVSLRFLVAINLATSGFWWWPLSPYRHKFYDKIQDINNGLGVELIDEGLSVFKGPRQPLTEVHLRSLLLCLTALPEPGNSSEGQAYVHYLGGLTFISLNCIQWRCEGQAFWQFLSSFKLLIAKADYVLPQESIESAIRRYLVEKFPDLDRPDQFMALVIQSDGPTGPGAKLADVFLMKLLCETIVRDSIIPSALRNKRNSALDPSTGQPGE